MCSVCQRFRQPFRPRHRARQVKLTQEDVDTICRRVVDHEMNTAYVAEQFDISRRRVQQLAKPYRDTGQIPTLDTPGRTPYADHPDDLEQRVLRLSHELGMGAVALAHVLRQRDEVQVDNNKVNEILLRHGEARVNKNKQGRRRPWVRFERMLPLTTVHMDWYHNQAKDWVICVQDDASRRVLAMRELPARSAEQSVEALDTAREAFGHLAPIREVITDHGSEFYASKRKQDGSADHAFEAYLTEQGIEHTLCKIGRPQSNGKLERFFQTYDKQRWRFASLGGFLAFYNGKRPHMSLDWDALETPGEAFDRLAQPYLVGHFVRQVEEH